MRIIKKKIFAFLFVALTAVSCAFSGGKEKTEKTKLKSTDQKLNVQKESDENSGSFNVIFLNTSENTDKINFFVPKMQKSGTKAEFLNDKKESPVSLIFEASIDGEGFLVDKLEGPGKLKLNCRLKEKDNSAGGDIIAYALILGGETENIKAENAKTFDISGKMGTAGFFITGGEKSGDFSISADIKEDCADISFIALSVSGAFDGAKKSTVKKVTALKENLIAALREYLKNLNAEGEKSEKKLTELYDFAETQEKSALDSALKAENLRKELESGFSGELSKAQKLIEESGANIKLTKENYSEILKSINSKEALNAQIMLQKSELCIKLAKSGEEQAKSAAKSAAELKEYANAALITLNETFSNLNTESDNKISDLEKGINNILN